MPTTQADITHRRHAIIETVFAYLIDGPLAHLPSGRSAANSAWAICAVMTHNLLRAAGTLTSDTHAVARGATLRRQLVGVAARLVRPQRHPSLSPVRGRLCPATVRQLSALIPHAEPRSPASWKPFSGSGWPPSTKVPPRSVWVRPGDAQLTRSVAAALDSTSVDGQDLEVFEGDNGPDQATQKVGAYEDQAAMVSPSLKRTPETVAEALVLAARVGRRDFGVYVIVKPVSALEIGSRNLGRHSQDSMTPQATSV